MNSQLLRIGGALVIAGICLSIIVNYRFADTPENNGVTSSTMQKQAPKLDWQAILAAQPQFAPELEEDPVETIVTRAIENSTLVGVISDSPVVAIILKPSSNQTVRVGLGESWTQDWVLIEVQTDQVVWRNEKTNEQFVQKLFIEHKPESLMSSAINY